MTSKPNIDGALSVIDAAILHVTNPAAITLPTAAGLRRARAEIVAIIAEQDALRADAERYRWLRDISVPPHNFYLSVPVEFYDVIYKASEVDKCIDEAIAALRATSPAQDKTMTDEIKIPEGFTAWPGGECPVHDNELVEVFFRDGSSDTGSACWYFWGMLNSRADIIGFRVVTP